MGLIKWRRARWVGLIACMAERWGCYAILVRKPEGKRLLLSLRRRWEDDIKIDWRMEGRRLHSFGSGQGEVAGCCGHGNEFTVYSKYKHTYYQNTYTIVKRPPHNKTHTYTHPHITNPTHTHTHTLQIPQIHTPTYYKSHKYTHPHITKQLKQPQYKIHNK